MIRLRPLVAAVLYQTFSNQIIHCSLGPITQFILHKIVLLVPAEELTKLKSPEHKTEELITDAKDVYDGFEHLYKESIKKERNDPL